MTQMGMEARLVAVSTDILPAGIDADTVTIFDYAAGVGMLAESVVIALDAVGLRAAVVGVCERDACAAAAVVARMENAAIHPAPVWDEAESFDGRRWRGCVDVFTAGYPCQPFSSAGRRRGHKDPRHLWPRVRRAIAEIEPGIVFLENVANHLRLGAREVLKDLRGLGYRVTAGLFSSAEVGASHLRKRLFILGVEDTARISGGQRAGRERVREAGQRMGDARVGGCRDAEPGRADEQPAPGFAGLADAECGGRVEDICNSASGNWQPDAPWGCCKLADAECSDTRAREEGGQGAAGSGRRGSSDQGEELADAECEPRGTEHVADEGRRQDRRSHDRTVPGQAGEGLADTEHAGLEGRRTAAADGRAGVDGDCGELPRYAPGRNDWRAWARVAALDPSRMPSVESGVRGVADGLAGRADRLRCVGNGVDPLAAAYALLSLFACLESA